MTPAYAAPRSTASTAAAEVQGGRAVNAPPPSPGTKAPTAANAASQAGSCAITQLAASTPPGRSSTRQEAAAGGAASRYKTMEVTTGSKLPGANGGAAASAGPGPRSPEHRCHVEWLVQQ